MSPQDFLAIVMSNPANAALMSRLPGLGLSQCFVTAGCLFQTVWNRRSGEPSGASIKDYDVFYFDDGDLSWDAEDDVIRRVDAATSDLGITVEVRNQARVHLWFERHFGASYPKLTSSQDGIDRFLIACTCVGIDVASRELYAPNGLAELEAGILRINEVNPQPELFRRKAAYYRARWPWLSITDTGLGAFG